MAPPSSLNPANPTVAGAASGGSAGTPPVAATGSYAQPPLPSTRSIGAFPPEAGSMSDINRTRSFAKLRNMSNGDLTR